MNSEVGKVLQNVELRLRGRGAVVAFGEAVMVSALWVVMKDYTLHPIFSTAAGAVLVAGVLLFLGLALLGRERPDEAPQRSLLHVDQLGINVALGMGSHKEMLRVMRELGGVRRLPLPSHEVRGSAGRPNDYVPLTPSQAEATIARVEKGVDDLLLSQAVPASQSIQSALPGATGATAPIPPDAIKGKDLKPEQS